MKNSFLIYLILGLMITACANDDTPDPGDPTPGDYYYNLTYDGTTYNYDSDIYQAGHLFGFEYFGGWVPEAGLFGNSIAIKFIFPDEVKNIDLNDVLVGKRIYFDDIPPFAEITHNFGAEVRFGGWGLDSTYFAEVTEVKFLRTEEGFAAADVYSVKGSFRTQIENAQGDYVDAIGDFFLQCSHSID
ncbi:MAG: hypothetical protein AB8F95_10390 [Bacteroidia bacterium]